MENGPITLKFGMTPPSLALIRGFRGYKNKLWKPHIFPRACVTDFLENF